MNRIKGIDVSRYNDLRAGNWDRTQPEGLGFVYVKCTQGSTFVSPTFQQQYEAVGETCALRGAYHYFMPYIAPELQAEHFIKTLKKFYQPGDLPPMIDVEAPDWKQILPAEHERRLKVMVKLVEEAFGVKPMIYTNYYYWLPAMGNSQSFRNNPLWVASYTKTPPKPFGGWVSTDGSLKVSVWQYTDKGKALGFSPLDCNWFFGTATDMWSITNCPEGLEPVPGMVQLKVKAMQRRLNQLVKQPGVLPLKDDGVWGTKTTEMLNHWQDAAGFKVQPVLTPEAWQELFNIQYV